MVPTWFTAGYLEGREWIMRKFAYFNLNIQNIDFKNDWRFSENQSRRNVKILE